MALILLVSALDTTTAFDPTKRVSQYVFDSWQTKDGLPVNGVSSIAQTPDGYLWLGTEEGLVRFDGVRFTVFSLRPHGASEAIALLVDRTGTLWIGTDAGLLRWQSAAPVLYTLRDGLPGRRVACLLEDRAGALWLCTDAGVSRFEKGRFTSFTTSNGLPHDRVQALLESSDGTLWIGTNGGLCRLRKDACTRISAGDGLPHDSVLALREDADGTVWVGTFAGMARLKDGSFSQLSDGIPSAPVNSLVVDRAGSLWFGTYGGGLFRYRENRAEQFVPSFGQSVNFIRGLHIDRQGSLWIATSQAGLGRLTDGPITAYTRVEGLPHDDVRAVLQDSRGRMWVGTHGGGLTRLVNGAFQTLTTRDGLLTDIVFALHHDRRGGLWVGTYNGGLNRIVDGRVVTVETGLPRNQFITTIQEDREGAIWLGSFGGGARRLANGSLTTFVTKHGLLNDVVFAIAEGHDGALWFGTRGGLCRLRDGAFRPYTTDHAVWTIFRDADATIWAGTRGGLIRVRDDRVTRYTTAEGLFHDSIFGIVEDDAGQLWMSSNNGIFRVRKQELTEFAEGTRQSVTSVAFGVADGMKTAECNGSTQPASWRASDGRLWFATAKGVVVVDPRRAPGGQDAPSVLIEDVVVEGRPVTGARPDEAATVAPGSRQFEFHYSAPGVRTPQRVRFRYRVHGIDRDWIDAGSRRTAYYTSLPPGRHEFRVEAAVEGEPWDATKAASYVLVVRPRFYQTWWFFALCAAVLLSGLWAGHRLRLNRALEMERVRTRIASDLHDDIGSSLSQIAILSEVARTRAGEDERFAEPLERIATLSRASVDAMGDIVWAIDPQRDTPAHLAQRMRRFASDLLPARGIEFRFESVDAGSPRLGADVRREAYLIFKEALNNAVRHGNPSRVDVSLTIGQDRMNLTVRDNGSGFDPNASLDGQGLRSMAARANRVGGTLDVATAGGEGVSIRLSVPV
jgi:ligand-binding sensor domain-containing protein/signal transduction histidine kinase